MSAKVVLVLGIMLLLTQAQLANAAAPQPPAPPLGGPIILDTGNPSLGAFFGFRIATGDVNGDQRPDIIVETPLEQVGTTTVARVYVFDGHTFAIIRTLTVPSCGRSTCGLRSAVAAADLTGDRLADIIVGAPLEQVGGNTQQGRVYLFDGLTGNLIRAIDTPTPQTGAFFGNSLAIGDVDHDGHHDIIIGAPGQCYPYLGMSVCGGAVYLFNGRNGALIRTITGPSAGADFGEALVSGDIDSDGYWDILVGAPREDVSGNIGQGRAYLVSGASGNILTMVNAIDPGGAASVTCRLGQPRCLFGSSVGLADVDGDGALEMLVGAPNLDYRVPDEGAAYVFRRNGQPLLVLTTPSPNRTICVITGCVPCGTECDRFGVAVSGGDVNHDGRSEIIVGANTEPAGGVSQYQGRTHIFDGTGQLLASYVSPGSPDTTEPEVLFGSWVATADVNLDHRADVIVGAPRDDVGSNPGQGRVYIFSSPPFFSCVAPPPQCTQ